MADFSHQLPVRELPARQTIRSEEDLTNHRKGPLGDMAVVPDNYVGPMSPGSVRETDYRRMVEVYGNIESGKSSLTIDTSNFLKDGEGNDLSLLDDPVGYIEALASAQQFREQYMGYMKDLVKTPAGLQLLETLDRSKHKTRIHYNEGGGNAAAADEWAATQLRPDGTHNTGSGSIIGVDPNDILWGKNEVCSSDPSERFQPWMRDRPRFGFYHELVHAYHNVRGDAAPGGGNWAQCTDGKNEIGNWEFQAAGIGPYRSEAVSENAIRAQMGAAERPTYGGAVPGSPNPWRQRKDDEEPPLRSPRR